MELKFTGDLSDINDGLDILQAELGYEQGDGGHSVHVEQREGPIYVANNSAQGDIQFEKPIHFFRALGLWLEQYKNETDFEIEEMPQFETSGAMLDASRNAVLTTEGIRDMLRKMSVMGLNILMVYTEDTYEVEDYPYFGYMRGRYTEVEMRACDEYASKLGIEMIPCMQALAHLTEALKWNYALPIRDTADILLVDEPKTYEFLESLIKAATKPFQSKRIHLGMDEAHQLGLGKYLDKNGYEERFNIMNRHLQKVVSITEDLGLEPMIWSDMYFRLGSKTGGYYDLEADIPDDVVASIPDVQLVYWDYYHSDEDFYRTFIKKHHELKSDSLFAGGLWTWNGISPNYGKATATTEAALNACKAEGVKEVFATMWGDNGGETPLTTALPMLQLFAEHTYHEDVSKEHLEERFNACTGGDYSAFMVLNEFDETPGVSKDNLHESNPSKFLLWQDVLIGLYDKNVEGLSLGEHYRHLKEKVAHAKTLNNEWHSVFDFYEQLADVLSIKAEIGIELKTAYDASDNARLKGLLEQLEHLGDRTKVLRAKHRDVWFAMNKPFGWEVVEIRYGGLIARIDTAHYRVGQYLAGDITELAELAEERLHFEGPYPMPEGSIGRNIYKRMATASNLS